MEVYRLMDISEHFRKPVVVYVPQQPTSNTGAKVMVGVAVMLLAFYSLHVWRQKKIEDKNFNNNQNSTEK